MKKILTSAAILSSIIVTSVSANTSIKDEPGLYKAVILSRTKIEKDFTNWKSYNNAINTFFEDLRVKPDYKKINDLEARLDNAIKNYEWKIYDRNYNLIFNIYYRLKLLKNYQLKGNIVNNSNNNSIITWTNNSQNSIITWTNNSSNSTNNNIIVWENLKNTKKDNSNIKNIISTSSSLPNQTTDSKTNSISNKSLYFKYKIPVNWVKYDKGETTLLVDETYSNYKNSVSFVITDYSKYNSVENYRDEYKKELERRYNNVRDLNSIYIDWKNTYVIRYYNWSEETNVYFTEYNGLVLVTNAVRRNSAISNNDPMTEIINSLIISK